MAWTVTPTPDELHLLGEAGSIYRDAGLLREAREIFLRIQALIPRNDVPEILLGTIKARERQSDQAILHYKKALTLNPTSAFAYGQMAESEILRRDYAAARDCCRQAIDLDPAGETGRFARNLLQVIDELPDPVG